MIFNETTIKTNCDLALSSLRGYRKLVRGIIADIRQLHIEIDSRDNTSRPTHVQVNDLNFSIRELKRRRHDYRRALASYYCWKKRTILFDKFKESYLKINKHRRCL